MCAVGKLHASDENSQQHSHFTELNSHLDNSLNVVVTKYSSSESIMCTNQIILKCNNSGKWSKRIESPFTISLMNGFDREISTGENAKMLKLREDRSMH